MSFPLTFAPALRRATSAAVALTLAAGLALGGSTAPAAAMDRGEVARTVIGLTALGLLVHQLSQNQARAEESRRPAPPPATRPRPGQKHVPAAHVLPASCAFETGPRGRRQTVLDRSCVERQLRHAPRLPATCAVRAERHGHWGHDRRARHGALYGVDCLKRAGFVLDRRR